MYKTEEYSEAVTNAGATPEKARKRGAEVHQAPTKPPPPPRVPAPTPSSEGPGSAATGGPVAAAGVSRRWRDRMTPAGVVRLHRRRARQPPPAGVVRAPTDPASPACVSERTGGGPTGVVSVSCPTPGPYPPGIAPSPPDRPGGPVAGPRRPRPVPGPAGARLVSAQSQALLRAPTGPASPLPRVRPTGPAAPSGRGLTGGGSVSAPRLGSSGRRPLVRPARRRCCAAIARSGASDPRLWETRARAMKRGCAVRSV